MGVHGLTTYLRENKHLLSRTVQVVQSQGKDVLHRIPVVVDAWSFIFEIVYCADLPGVYGGEYTQFATLVEQVVRAWIEVGLEIHFVFDGPYPALKFPTLVSRITQHIQSGLLFFRTSATARATPRFLHLPPLAYSVCVNTLLRLARPGSTKSMNLSGALHVHFADEEGDPYAVALAGKLNAYVAGKDSDFVVLNAEDYRGYVPLDEMVWTFTTAALWDGEGSVYSVSVAGESEAGDREMDEDGFQTVRKIKSKKKRAATNRDQQAGRGILPPSALPSTEPLPDGQLALSFTIYDPTVLATHLEIPVSLLPLLGAFLGNDFTGASGSDGTGPPPATTAEIRAKGRHANLQRLFFERGLTHGQRVARVAGCLGGILSTAFGASTSAGGKKRTRGKKQAIGSVMELIDTAVTSLLVRPLDTFATGEREAIVERIAEATLQYAIPRAEGEGVGGVEGYDVGEEDMALRWASDLCPLHAPEACPLVGILSGLIRARDSALSLDDHEPEARDQDPLDQVRARYVVAYRQGLLDPHILDTVQTATMWPRMFLEDPDKETLQRSVGRPIRLWTYAVLDAGIGLPSAPEPERDEEDEEEDDDELIDVVEDDDSESDEGRGADPLARLRGALKELDGDADGADVSPPSKLLTPAALHDSRPKAISVTEYVRRGTRLATEEIIVSSLAELLKGVSLDLPHDLTVPPQLWPEKTRRALLLCVLASGGLAVSSLPDEHLIGVLAVRWVVQTMHLRAQENPGVKERIVERWTQAEAKAALGSFVGQNSSLQAPEANESEGPALPPLERHIQLVTQVFTAVDAIEQLAQVLLLSSTVTSPAWRFSGSRCHALLSGRVPLRTGQLEDAVWSACVEGVEDAFAAPPQRRKDKKAKARAAPPVAKSGSRGGVKSASLFGLLADVEA